MSTADVQLVQRSYPAIYLACHVDHVRTKSNRHHISAHDASLLAHLDEKDPVTPSALARHLGVTASTLSAALTRVESLGHVARIPHSRDRRKIELRLTPSGTKAVLGASVLDQRRVAAVLAELPPAQQRQAVQGLALLAQAARSYQAKTPRRKRW
jgi:DNA-binding MarR family transcriptional regulator